MPDAMLAPKAGPTPRSRVPYFLPDGELKPLLRGHFHQWAAVASAVAGITLIVFAAPGIGRVSATVYAVCITAMFTISALYHRVRWTSVAHARMRRADHSGIFLAIAGTYTPIANALTGWIRPTLLVAVWTIAVVGITVEWLPVKPPRGYVTGVYVGMGWVAVIAIPAMVTQLPVSALLLILAGGLIYTGGAFIHAFQWPNPCPSLFGFHEIWHIFVVAAAACHYLAVWFVLPH